MAMSNSNYGNSNYGNTNYGYPSSSGFSSPYSSTPPAGMRPPRPRFAYAGPSVYPRPRSSASKPNPDSSYPDHRLKNFGSNSPDISYMREDNNSFQLNNSQNSDYYSCNDSFYASPKQNTMCGDSENYAFQSNTKFSSGDYFYAKKEMNPTKNSGNFPLLGNNQNPLRGNSENFAMQRNTSQFPPGNGYRYGSKDVHATESSGNYQNSIHSKQRFGPPFARRKFVKAKRNMAQKSDLHCGLCNLDFTSQVPLDMHIRGAKHNKKLKSQNALQVIQSQGQAKEIDNVGKVFRCELCSIMLNSSLQLQMHLEGSKHKNKVLKLEQAREKEEEEKKESEMKVEEEIKPEICEQNGKGTESLVRPLPEDFDDPRPTKLAKYSCEVCNLILNSESQLQQHLGSKRHEAKVQGKPYIKARKNKKQSAKTTGEQDSTPMEEEKTENGSKEEKTENGSKEEKTENGSKEEKIENGSKEEKTENGSKEEKTENGSKEEKTENGSNEEGADNQNTVLGVKSLKASFVPAEVLQ